MGALSKANLSFFYFPKLKFIPKMYWITNYHRGNLLGGADTKHIRNTNEINGRTLFNTEINEFYRNDKNIFCGRKSKPIKIIIIDTRLYLLFLVAPPMLVPFRKNFLSYFCYLYLFLSNCIKIKYKTWPFCQAKHVSDERRNKSWYVAFTQKVAIFGSNCFLLSHTRKNFVYRIIPKTIRPLL